MRTTSCGTTIYFRALDLENEPIPNTGDKDAVAGEQKYDTANYSWDWNYQPPDHAGDAEGLSASKSYNNPGDRMVQLYVYDDDGDGYTDDENVSDSVNIRVKLTLETDWMEGVAGQCTAADHALPGGVEGVWATANYTLAIDGDHDTDCEHRDPNPPNHSYNYIGDVLSDQEIYDYLDDYEGQGCHLYLMGGHRYREALDWQGMTEEVPGNHDLGMVFAFSGFPPVKDDESKRAVMVHENACHDGDVGAIGDCESADPCVCKSPHTSGSFCADCIAELVAAQDLDN